MTGITQVQWHDLVAALRRRLEDGIAGTPETGAELAAVLAHLDGIGTAEGPPGIPGHPLTRHLDRALALADIGAPHLAGVLRPLADRLPWRYGYAARPDAPGLETAMGWAEIVGPAAPIPSRHVCLGLTLIGPDTHYLPHRHPAVELYHVVAGHAAWTLEGETAIHPPGTTLLHPAHATHAMRTGSEPLLAIYTWSGDLLSPSVWADPSRLQEPA